MQLEQTIIQLKHIFEADFFKGSSADDIESRKTDKQKQEDTVKKAKEEATRVLRQEQLVVATEKYNKILTVIDKLGFTPIRPTPPIDGGRMIDFSILRARNKDGLGLWFRVTGLFSMVSVYGGYSSDSEDADTRKLQQFVADEQPDTINISTNKTEDQIANEITRRLLLSLKVSVERMKGRVGQEIIDLNKNRKMIRDTVSILGLRDQTFDSNSEIYTYLHGNVDRFELEPAYGGDTANIKLSVKAEALPAFLKMIKKLG